MIEPRKSSLDLTFHDNGVVQMNIDMPGSSANVLTTNLFAEMDSTLAALQARDDLRGLILISSKPTIFVAGADLKRIFATLDWPDEKIIQFCEDGRDVMKRLSQMPFPTVAAIHGAAVGGGLELAMWCDRRIATGDPKTVLGLPEVRLGLVPGWAGTVRLPRLTSLETAVDLITSGRSINAAEALQVGLIDQIVGREELVSAAADRIDAENSSRSYLIDRQRICGAVQNSGEARAIRKMFEARIAASTEIYPYACQLVMEHLIETSDCSHDEACQGESLTMAKVYGSDPSYGLLNNFFLGEHNRKHPGWVDIKLAEKPIRRIGIVGSGLMGSSIAKICLERKCDVVLWDANQAVLQQAICALDAVHSAGILTEARDYADFAECDLVLESVVEVAEVKQTVLQRIEQFVSGEAIIATNTSAIPLKKLATSLARPQRFCGVHFCHPQLMRLVEVVKGESSNAKTIADSAAWVKSLGKMPVVVADSAGFVVNRMLAAMLDQAFRLFRHGYSIVEIDDAMREFGLRGGPFEIVDVIGADVCMYAGREMWDAGKSCVTMTPVLPRLVKHGRLGRKSGQGFYRYESIDGERVWDPEIEQLLACYVDGHPVSVKIAESICAVMTLEAARLLDEQIVADPRDIDVCVIHGFSFPTHVGGNLFWADRFGLANVNAILAELSKEDAKLAPTDRMLDMEKDGTMFYSHTVLPR